MLQPEEEQVLLGMLGKQHMELKLLYSADTDGWDATTFHKKCDDKGPTVTVARNAKGYVFGGYTSQPWGGNRQWVQDAQACLFRLRKENMVRPAYYKGKDGWIYDANSQGPSFGKTSRIGTEIVLGFLQHGGKHVQLNYPENAFDMEGHSSENIAGNLSDVKNVDVYSFVDKPGPLLQNPWRKPVENWTENTHGLLKEWLESYKPADQLAVTHANIVMVGPTRAGKSSFFNTINSVYRGYVTSQAAAGTGPHSLTTRHRKYEIRAKTGEQSLRFRLWDTMGLENVFGLDVHEFIYLLDGHIPDGFQFNPIAPITPNTPGFRKQPTLSEETHVVVFVVSAASVDKMSKKTQNKVQVIRSQVNHRNIPLVVLLTHVDKICRDVAEDASRTFMSPVIKRIVENLAEEVGVPRANVLPVRNYESESELDQNVDILAMIAVRQMLRLAESRFDELICEQTTQPDCDENENSPIKRGNSTPSNETLQN